MNCFYIIRDLMLGTLTLFYVKNKGTEQPAHPHSLISSFVICFLQCMISKFASNKNLAFSLVYVSEQAGLNLILSEIPRMRFSG